MAQASTTIDVYLEIGTKRIFAGVLAWPGWCRTGRDEASALRSLFEAGPRYARILRPAGVAVQLPSTVSSFVVTERLPGNATTDFGAPARVPSSDADPIDDTELRRLDAILQACWRAFDDAVEHAEGKALRTGPQGGAERSTQSVSMCWAQNSVTLRAWVGKWRPLTRSSRPTRTSGMQF